MNESKWDVLDPARSSLRALAAQLEREISRLDVADARNDVSAIGAWPYFSAERNRG